MDTQSTPIPEQRPQGVTPDQLIVTGTQEQALRAMNSEQAPASAAEVAPAGAPRPGAVVTPQNTAAPLTRDDVAAAIAGTPAPTSSLPVVAPAVAADQDVVEPEWVDAAEQAITKTAGNPHDEEEAVESLQVDYLKKRYGYEVKKSEET